MHGEPIPVSPTGATARHVLLHPVFLIFAFACAIAAFGIDRLFGTQRDASLMVQVREQARLTLALIESELQMGGAVRPDENGAAQAPFARRLETALARATAAGGDTLQLAIFDESGSQIAGARSLHEGRAQRLPWHSGTRSGHALAAPGAARRAAHAATVRTFRALGAGAGFALLALAALLLERRDRPRRPVQAHTPAPSGNQQDSRDEIQTGRGSNVAMQRYEQIVSTSHDLMAILDKDCRYLAVNRRFEDIYGKAADEIIGLSIAEVAGGQTQDDFREYIDRALRGESGTLRAWRQLPKGSQRFLDSRFSPYREPDGSISGALVFTRDLTDLKRALDALTESETRFRALVEATSDWVWEIDADAVYTYASPKVKELLGMEPGEILGKTPFDLMADSEAQRIRKAFGEIMRDRRAFSSLENVNLTKDGTEVVLETSGVPVFAPDGRFCGFRGIDRDITQRKRSERLLALQRLTLENIAVGRSLTTILQGLAVRLLEFLPGSWCAILLLDDERLRLAVGPGLSEPAKQFMDRLELMEGHTPFVDAVLADTPVIVPDVAQESRWQALKQLGAEGNLASYWCFPIRVNHVAIGSLSVALEVSSVPDEKYRGIMEMAASLSGVAIERARAQCQLEDYAQQLQRLSQQLLEAQEKERWRIARELHDEVGQALTALKINLHTVTDKIPSAGTQGLMQDSMDIVELVLRQIRDMSLDLRPPMLDDLGLSSALQWYLNRQGKRSGLSIRFCPAEGDLRLDSAIETACYRIAQEAVTNVIRHASAKQMCIALNSQGDDFSLTVSDDGHGFDVRRATHRAATGRSIGLLGMQERAALAGGRVRVTSSFRGTEVCASFPLRKPA